jgi:hypothetical protein
MKQENPKSFAKITSPKHIGLLISCLTLIDWLDTFLKIFDNIIYNMFWDLQHPDLTVTSEEKVLNAILMWGLGVKELYGWEVVDELIINLAPEHLFGERLLSVQDLLHFVRFPLLPHALLKKVYRPLI